MVFSTTKPAKVVILSVIDDIKNGVCKVKYAFRFGITEVTHSEQVIDPETGTTIEQQVQGWEYEEIVKEETVPLTRKSIIPNLLELYYQAEASILEQNLQLAKTQLPKELNP